MKTFKLLLSLILISSFLTCSDDDSNNNSEQGDSLGTYAGIMVGSSGYYKIEITPSGSEAEINFNGEQYNLSNVIQVQSGSQLLDLNFTNGDISMLFSVDEDGTNPSVSFAIPGHTIESTIDRLGLNQRLTLYEGTSSSTSGAAFFNATYNITLVDRGDCEECRSFESIEKVTGSSSPEQIGNINRTNGFYQINGNTITFNFNGQSISGTINGNTISHMEPSVEWELIEKLQLQLQQ